MSPVTIDVPHRLGKEGAKARLRAKVGDLPAHIPGGMATVTSDWPAPDVMQLGVTALGQTVDARLTVEETLVRVELVLPAMLGFFSGMIAAAVKEGGTKMLDDKRAG